MYYDRHRNSYINEYRETEVNHVVLFCLSRTQTETYRQCQRSSLISAYPKVEKCVTIIYKLINVLGYYSILVNSKSTVFTVIQSFSTNNGLQRSSFPFGIFWNKKHTYRSMLHLSIVTIDIAYHAELSMILSIRKQMAEAATFQLQFILTLFFENVFELHEEIFK